MSALNDFFSALADKIRSKTGTATTYTPAQMVSDGIDDVFAAGYDAGGGGSSTGIPITPSNSSPVSLTNGEVYQPTSDGYAIASYSNITPTTTPAAVSSGNIYKITSSGGYVCSTNQSITPSVSGSYFGAGFCTMTSSGYAYPYASRVMVDRMDYDVTYLSSSNTNNREPFTYNVTESATYIVSAFAETNCSSDDGKISIMQNGLSKASSYVSTRTSTSVFGVVSFNFSCNAGDTISLRCGWINSHSNVWWKAGWTVYRAKPYNG